VAQEHAFVVSRGSRCQATVVSYQEYVSQSSTSPPVAESLRLDGWWSEGACGLPTPAQVERKRTQHDPLAYAALLNGARISLVCQSLQIKQRTKISNKDSLRGQDKTSRNSQFLILHQLRTCLLCAPHPLLSTQPSALVTQHSVGTQCLSAQRAPRSRAATCAQPTLSGMLSR
jgi:hypothetical protein